MLAFAYYLLKVLICSGILYGYYLLALKNKIFHSWNRFYLLAMVILALASPVIKINIWQKPQAAPAPVIQLLQVVNTGEEFVYNYSNVDRGYQIDASAVSLLIYSLVSAFLLVFLILTLIKIGRLKYSYPATLIEGIKFRNTNAKGTPFSFFNNIFWNNKIDLNTFSGKQIFQHEVAHIREKHSYDKIFMNIVLIFFWCNPVFWLVRRELSLIHEFIADKKAVEDNDTAAFAAMILQATYPRQRFTITNHFFYSPLKRRLAMITKNRNSKINYPSRLLVLPLAAVVFFAFTLKMKPFSSAGYAGKKITVIIDAGHGGDDIGCSVNGINEKDITLSVAKQILNLNKNENINIVLTRSADSSIGVKQRVELAKSVNADFYISIHIDGNILKPGNSGFSVLVAKNDNVYLAQSKVLGSDLIGSFKNYKLPVHNSLEQRAGGIWVLKANECPAVLIEAGFMTNHHDLEYLIKDNNQKIIAQNILDGIEKFAQHHLAMQSNQLMLRDTIPGDKKPGSLPYVGDALIIVDGKEISKDEMKKIDPKSIKSISVLKGEAAIAKYGNKGKNGVIEITMKDNQVLRDTVPGAGSTVLHGGKNGSTKMTTKDKEVNLVTTDTTPNKGASVLLNGVKIQPLIFLDGKEISDEEMKKMNPNNIRSIVVLKGETAIKKYGDKGKNGVLEIQSKVNTGYDTLPKPPTSLP